MSEYIKKLDNILEGVENYRFDDANVDEWKELTISVLKGAISREKANQEADELAYSVWNKLANLSEPKLSEPKLNENQEIVLAWLKERYEKNNERPSTVIYFLTNHYSFSFEGHGKAKRSFRALDSAQELQVLQAFATWALDQC